MQKEAYGDAPEAARTAGTLISAAEEVPLLAPRAVAYAGGLDVSWHFLAPLLTVVSRGRVQGYLERDTWRVQGRRYAFFPGV
jgi:hypothetical protein